MRKLKLQDLEVSSFVISGTGESPRGTVRANSGASTTYYPPSYDTFCPTNDCEPPPASRGGSCQASCPNYTCEGITCGILIC